jgi:integrase
MESVEAAPAARGPRMTLDDLAARYRTHLIRQDRKRSTLTAIESAVRVHLAPYFDGRSIDSITFENVESLVALMEGKSLSAKSIENYVGILSAMLKWAALPPRRWIPGNPCEGVELPGVPDVEEIRYLDAAEWEAVLRHVQPGDYAAIDRAFYLTAIMVGLRHGELCALLWRDVDWAAGRIRVRRNWVLGDYATPKSRRASRSVPMSDRLGGELDRLYRACGEPSLDSLVFPDPATGDPLDKARNLRRFRKALKAAAVDETYNLHSLRHTFGTRMAAAGVPLRTLQEWMGHRDSATTQRYADYAPSVHEQSMIERAWAPSPGLGSNLGSNLSESDVISDDPNDAVEPNET